MMLAQSKTPSPGQIGARYEKSLAAYLDDPDESGLLEANDLGRVFLLTGDGLLSLAASHHAAVAAFGELSGEHQNELAAAFLTEAMSPALMSVLGFQRANEALIALNAELEQRVSDRTAVLMSEVAVRQKAEERIRGLLDAVPDGLLIADKAGRIVLTNQRLGAMFGYRSDEIVGMEINALLSEHSQGQYTALMLESTAAPGSRGKGRELEAKRRDGDEFPVEISLSQTENGDGIAIIAAVRDISDRKATENQLRQAQKMDAVGRLTGGVAHDFNNILTIIIGNLQLLERALVGNDPAVSRIGKIMAAAHSGAELTRRLLSFSRQQVLETTTVDINELVGSMEEMLRRTMGGNITVSTSLSAERSLARTDRNQLEHALLNLAINARHAMPNGGRLLIATRRSELSTRYAETHNEVTPGRYIEIAVSDTGTGIPHDIIDKIFEPFFTTKSQGEGTGLGLSTVFGFMKQSGGHISVYTEPGQGTTFRLFAAEVQNDAGILADGQRKNVDRLVSAAGRRPTILVVEDEAGVREVAVSLLTQGGFDVIEAGNGPSGLQMFNDHPEIELVFSDVVMPGGMNGVQMMDLIWKQRPDMPALFASGHAEHALKDRETLTARSAFLEKPYDDAELCYRIWTLLEGPDHEQATNCTNR